MCAQSDSEAAAVSVAASDSGRACPPANPELIADLVVANQILFDQGVVDGFGHVSARHDADPDLFLLARNMAPGQVTAEDIVTFTHDGDPLDAKGRRVYLERFIHGSIYRARPDVMAVIHSHSHAIVPLSVSRQTRLRAVFHMAGFIGQCAPVFEIRDTAGDATDLLISSDALGRALAQTLGDGTIVLMRGHGSTVVADSVPRAVYRAIYAELNARYQTEAMRMGEITYLTEGESAATMVSIEGQIKRPWDLWKAQAAARRA